MKIHRITIALLLGALMLFASCSYKAGARGPTEDLADKDVKFMKEAAMGGVAEVQLGQLALRNAASPEVREFGRRMVEDHTLANQRLEQLAQTKDVRLPQHPSEKHQRAMDRLSKLRGSEFDREYMSQMVEDHEETIDQFEDQADDGKDPALKAFAGSTLPALEHHLREAKTLNSLVSR